MWTLCKTVKIQLTIHFLSDQQFNKEYWENIFFIQFGISHFLLNFTLYILFLSTYFLICFLPSSFSNIGERGGSQVYCQKEDFHYPQNRMTFPKWRSAWIIWLKLCQADNHNHNLLFQCKHCHLFKALFWTYDLISRRWVGRNEKGFMLDLVRENTYIIQPLNTCRNSNQKSRIMMAKILNIRNAAQVIDYHLHVVQRT